MPFHKGIEQMWVNFSTFKEELTEDNFIFLPKMSMNGSSIHFRQITSFYSLFLSFRQITDDDCLFCLNVGSWNNG